jgi:hypothetical protein
MPNYEIKIIHQQSGLSLFVTHESNIPKDEWYNDEKLFTEVLNNIDIIPLGPIEESQN